MALSSAGATATCNPAPTNGNVCHYTIDGIHTTSSEIYWQSVAVGAWVQVNFDRVYSIKLVRYMPRFATGDQINRIEMEFESDPPIQVDWHCLVIQVDSNDALGIVN